MRVQDFLNVDRGDERLRDLEHHGERALAACCAHRRQVQIDMQPQALAELGGAQLRPQHIVCAGIDECLELGILEIATEHDAGRVGGAGMMLQRPKHLARAWQAVLHVEDDESEEFGSQCSWQRPRAFDERMP
jgi:hypothetical protein